MRWALVIVALAGCSKILGIDDLHGPGGHGDGGADGKLSDATSGDAPPDVIVGPQIRISGKVFATSGVSTAGLKVDLLRVADDASLGSTTIDANSQYVFVVLTGGNTVIPYLHVTGLASQGERDSFVYFPHPLVTDTTQDIPLYTQTDLQNFAQQGGIPGGQGGNLAFAVVHTTAAQTMAPLAGITVTTQPNTIVRYTNTAGQIDSTLASTTGTGTACAFNIQPGMSAPTTITGTGQVSQLASQDIRVKLAAVYVVGLEL